MTPAEGATPPPGSGHSRRSVLGSGALLAGAALLGGTAGHAAGASSATTPSGPDATVAQGADVEPFFGTHQSGILTRQQAHGSFLGLKLRAGTGRDQVRAMMQLLSDDAARMTRGEAPLGALEADIVNLPRRLTVTFGFGAGLFTAIKTPEAIPPALAALPDFLADRLRPQWGQSDLVVQICSDEPVAMSYAVRRVARDAAPFATVAWVQSGFANAVGTEAPGTTPRNLMGMRDGTANETDPTQAAAVVWSTDPRYPWLVGGSHLVLRRMAINLTTWDDVSVEGKELAFGRRLGSGAPLNGTKEHDLIDRDAVDDRGFPAIAPNAHAALAQARSSDERILRRPYNYDIGLDADGQPDAGLLFVAYQRDVATAFIPIQKRLSASDALNTWATHIGSASYAIPPGAREGSYVGAGLLDA